MNLPATDKFDKLLLGFLVLFLTGLLWVSHYHEIGGYGVETDFYGSYAHDAENLLQGRALEEPDHGPIYTFVLAGGILIFGDTFVAAKMISILSAIGFVFFAFRTIRQLFDSQKGGLTAILLGIAVVPHAILASQDVFFAFQVTLAIYMLFRRGAITRRNVFWCGIVSAIALLTRYDAAIVPVGVLFIILFLNIEGWTWQQRMSAMGMYIFAFMLLFGPWLLFNLIQHGHPLPTRLHTAMGAYYYGGFEDRIGGEGMEYGASEFDSISSIIFSDPLHFVSHYAKTAVRHFQKMLFLVIRFPAYLLFIPGVLLVLRQASKRQMAYFVFPVLGFLILCLTIFNPRYYLYFFPFVMFVPVFFCFNEKWVTDKDAFLKSPIFRSIMSGVFVLVVFSYGFHSFEQTRGNIELEPVELIEAASHLKERASDGDVIIARKPHLGFLAGLRTAYFPQVKSVDELVTYAREIEATFVLYSYVEERMRPELGVLAHADSLAGQLQLIYASRAPLVRLFEIRN